MATLIPKLRCCMGVGALTLPGPSVLPGWVPRKESLRLDPTPHQYSLARRKWEENLNFFDPSSNSFSLFKACLVPVWPARILLWTHRKPAPDITAFTQKNGKCEFNPSSLSGGQKPPSFQDSLRTLPTLKGSQRGISSEAVVVWWAAANTTHLSPGRTDLPWKLHFFLFPGTGAHQTACSLLETLISEQILYQ